MNLLFVYNADSGPINTLFDIAHKVISPSTYQCDLCFLTHGTFAEKDAWKAFRKTTNLNLEFLHKDQFEECYGLSFSYPLILEKADGLSVFLSAESISQISSVADLITRIERQVPE